MGRFVKMLTQSYAWQAQASPHGIMIGKHCDSEGRVFRTRIRLVRTILCYPTHRIAELR